ncbi:SPOR domain-containing protein [Prevotella sp. kh1p2]|uniref:SPOR domain-containing protein n=1 Tax=Prevotella sp. kh1p2 TaxID=1761883 RepID=UPI0008C1BC0A|nr:SPOR domain-containing protein [Prevotella sp. kh1p2]SES96237.1 Sporulation related domain-containing protein [Prevotella sp. kh1p2]SNU11328.1 Sporulation related domain-containing protein [Prevotellaceae bacterium KH2P17]
MKKFMVLCAGFCAALVLASCGSSKESAYKKAYEKAKAQETTQVSEEPSADAVSVTPMVEQPATQTTVVDNVDNATYRTEDVTVVNGSGLQQFSVVVGSFSLKANAEGLQNTLKASGLDAQVAYNSERNMYRVVASTFADKGAAVQSRNQLRATYPDAWLLYKK